MRAAGGSMVPTTVGPFDLDLTEVTAAAYAACVQAARCTEPTPERDCTGRAPGLENHPMNCVTFNQARAYCNTYGKRLPTVPEWVFAATGGDGRKYAWGNEPPDASRTNVADRQYSRAQQARGFGGNEGAPLHSGDDHFAATAPVGSFPADRSPFGALDMTGNVSEWTDGADNPPTNAQLPDGDLTTRPIRGGNWMSSSVEVIFVYASSGTAVDRSYASLGFRCAKS